jgi:hypothetical protein
MADLRGADGGQIALCEFAVKGAIEVVGQLGTVIADAYFELRRCWKRGLACSRGARSHPGLLSFISFKS